uniref:Ig-like domain-containing protein n=1 Tax=Sinocyclocheilus grahami TaxID=75366 RepID=A0A672QJ50_SINGR
MILWYEQLKGDSALNLIGYVLYKNPATESQYTNQFNITGDGAKSSTLEFKPEASRRSVTYYCAASKAHVPNYNQINWYRQNQDHGFTLMGYLLEKEPYKENDFKDKIEMSGDGNNNGYLNIKSLSSNDNAVYFCGQAVFGNGTKLTVLERDISKPEVEILKPSGNETSCKQKVTLVCVAKNFYPDHVSITWKIGSKDINDDVATDPYATQDKETKLFSITSRLKVSKKEFKPQNTFRCTVRFYNETDVYTESKTI